MVVTRAMAARSADHPSVDASSPGGRRYRYPSSSSSSSSSSSTSFSTPRTPTDTITKAKDSFSCSSYVSLSSHIQKLIDVIDSKFKQYSLQFEHICNRLSNVEELINDHHSIINEIERELSIVADKLKNVFSKSSDSLSSHSGSYKLHKSTQTDHSCSSSFPIMFPLNSNSQPTPAPVVSNPPRSTVYWRSTPSTRPTSPLPTSTHPRRTFPPAPSFPLKRSPLRNTRRSAPSTRPTFPLPTSTHPRRTVPPAPPSPPRRSSLRNTSSRTPHAPSSYAHNPSHNINPSTLIMGDSNTKYVNLPHANYHRIPTYTIEGIDPVKCIGYAKLWLHVGINNLKSIRCGGLGDVHRSFNLFMHKVDLIGKLSPRTTVIISPILSTGVSTLNDRARTFNRLLFSTNRWWHTLNFSIFATRNNMLQSHFRCYGNPKDKIHIGFHGIRELERIIAKEISRVDARSYSVVAKSDIP